MFIIGCDYVVHSASQTLSHKRKHERRQAMPYSPMQPRLPTPPQLSLPKWENTSETANTPSSQNSPAQIDPQILSATTQLLQHAMRITEIAWQLHQNPSPAENEDPETMLSHQVLREIIPTMTLFTGGKSCENEQCSLNSTGTDHFHCFRAGCMDTMEDESCSPEPLNDSEIQHATLSSGDMESWRDHWFTHAWQTALAHLGFKKCAGELCGGGERSTPHIHCFLWPSCDFCVEASTVRSNAPALLRHLVRHDRHFTAPPVKDHITLPMEASAVPRKRGRPPKHSRDVHVPRMELPPEVCIDPNPQLELPMEAFIEAGPLMVAGGAKYFPSDGPRCVDRHCPFYAQKQSHFHCVRPRCYMATASLFILNAHRREFHGQVTIEPGYEYFDRSIDCRRPACYTKRDTNHFHCLRPRCGYTFARVGKMVQHTNIHEPGPMSIEEQGVQPMIPPPLGAERDPFMNMIMMNMLHNRMVQMNSTAPPNLYKQEEGMEWENGNGEVNEMPNIDNNETFKKSPQTSSPTEPSDDFWRRPSSLRK